METPTPPTITPRVDPRHAKTTVENRLLVGRLQRPYLILNEYLYRRHDHHLKVAPIYRNKSGQLYYYESELMLLPLDAPMRMKPLEDLV